MRTRTLVTAAAIGVASGVLAAPAALAAPPGPGWLALNPTHGRPGMAVWAVTNICRSQRGFVNSAALTGIVVRRHGADRVLVGRGFVRHVPRGFYRVFLTCQRGPSGFTVFRVDR